MKFATTAVMALLLAEQTTAFSPFATIKTNYKTSTTTSSSLAMAIDMPPAEDTTVVTTTVATASTTPVLEKSQYGPTDVRYSDFLKLIDGDKIEKVTFSADGTQLLGVDNDGTRLKIESLPNDPGLLSQLTDHKVRACRAVQYNIVQYSTVQCNAYNTQFFCFVNVNTQSTNETRYKVVYSSYEQQL